MLIRILTNTRKLSLFFLFSGITVLFTSCNENDPEPQPTEPEFYISYELQFNRSIEQLTTLVQLAGLADMTEYINYDISLYSITYNTNYLGEPVIASGVVTFPETSESMPLLSFQHGTITKNSEAPTEDLATYGLLSSLAGAGYIFLIPDFIGFGSSADIVHPYYHAPSTAKSITDMLLASRELAEDLQYLFSGQVFLAGYSEGGYATMAVHKSMEDKTMTGFELIASAPASGGYDLKGMQEYFFSLDQYSEPYYLAYVAKSYSMVYNRPEIFSDMFNEPYASIIPDVFDGSLSGGQINNLLTTSIPDLIQPEILQNIDTDLKYRYILDAFEDNSLDNWVPAKTMFMYHGTEDITVPYQNSADTYTNMLNLGADQEIVTFTAIEGANHGSGILPYLMEVVEQFEKIR